MDKFLQFIAIGMKAGAYILGSSASVSAARAGKVRLFLLSCDASDNTKKMVRNTAGTYDIPIIEHYEMAALGKAVGKLQLSVIGVNNEKIARQLTVLYGQIGIRGNA